MLKVLDHPLGARSATFQPLFRIISWLLLSFAFYLSVASCILPVAALDVLSRRDLTQGLAVLDSPQPDAVLNAGSASDVSIDVSAASGTTAGIDLLEVYLVSATQQKNLTVSSGPQLLSQEPGSTVKHIHWTVPTCLQTGAFNLTLYETSHINGSSFFAITPIPVQVRNTGNVSESCDVSENTLQSQPQLSSPPPAESVTNGTDTAGTDSVNATASVTTAPANATASASTTIASTNATDSAITPTPTATDVPQSTSTSSGNIITVTAGDGDITIDISGLPGTIVVEPSGGAPPDSTVTSSMGFITIFKTVAPTATATLTEVITAPVTLTLEETQTILSTTQVVATQVSSPQQAGLLPISSGSTVLHPSTIRLHWMLLVSALLYVLWPSL
ncbi:hypothetical protein C2E23DRAFT_152952 [Lenzites betulinus]|nr:hypothetical protein C2E23DRAFT_152952 [Lenzites betulinus]